MEGIILGNYEDKKKCNLIRINTDGSIEHYEPSANGFVLIKTDPAPASADHTHSKVSEKIKVPGNLTLVFENGILVDVVKDS